MMRKEHGRIDVLLGFIIVVVAVGFAIYEFWVNEHALQPSITQSPAKSLIDGARDKVNDAIEKDISRIPADDSTQPPVQSDK